MDLSLKKWEKIGSIEREALARRLAMQLPSGFFFSSIQLYKLGDRQHHVALYKQGSSTFALIPGGEISIGYNSIRTWEPTPDELKSWQETAIEYGIDIGMEEYIAEVTLPSRRVEFSPFLIETEAIEIGWETIEIDDPQVQEILPQLRERRWRWMTISRKDSRTRVRIAEYGNTIAERTFSITHQQWTERLNRSGFRLPTSDEWEYVCGDGASTLFRWGDRVPCDRYPTDIIPSNDWTYHRQPNVFGLSIASDPYKVELVAEVGMTRGGDTGCAICGGTGFFVGWLPLATAYFEEYCCTYEPTQSIAVDYTVARRVLELSEL